MAKKQWKEIQDWLVYARLYAKRVAMERMPHTVSVNDLYLGIEKGAENNGLYPPPNIPITKRGQALCAVFAGPEFYNTKQTVLSVNPISRSRRIFVWEYTPEFDERTNRPSRWAKGGKGW